MTRRALARRLPTGEAAPRIDVVQADKEAFTGGKFTAMLERAAREILAVTYWFDPAQYQESYPVTVRFSGHRVDVKGRLQAGDRFTQDETIKGVIPGSGPISLTARVHDINPGEWVVTARVLRSAHSVRGSQGQEDATSAASSLGPITRFWQRWAPSVESVEHTSTCLIPFAHIPGIVPGIWGAMVALGIIIALTIQALVISAAHLAVGPWWAVALGAIVVGIIGAKVWYIFQYRREHLINGWCIQGFITGATLAAAILLVVFHLPDRIFLDATAPGLLLAMAVGRVGCFFAGCCGGRPTASCWGVWSSDQRVGMRRIPTQLMESALALSLGLAALGIILFHGPEGGALFVGGLAAYTTMRQGILLLRSEPRKWKPAAPITATLSALVLVTAIIVHTW